MLILVHIGEEFPSYMNTCIRQVNSVSLIPVHVLIAEKHVSQLTGECTPVVLESLHIDELDKSFNDTSVLGRGGFCKRFFYLHTYMKRNNYTDVFYIEYDNLVYLDFTEKLPIFQQKSMWCVVDAEDRCVPSFVYFKDVCITQRLIGSYIEGSAQGLDTMQTLSKFVKDNLDVGCLPTSTKYSEAIPSKSYEYADSFGFLFDDAWSGDADNRNTGEFHENTLGQCHKAMVEWKEGKPFLYLPLVNLHSHSKHVQRSAGPKIAILHWGQSRTLDDTYSSHIEHVYNVLSNNNIKYDVYMHSWQKPNGSNDYSKFNFKEVLVEDQTPLIKEIDDTFEEYWYKHIFIANGGDSLNEWKPDAVKHGLYAMTSMKRVTEMCINSGIQYDYIMYFRSDCRFFSDISLEYFKINNDSIVCPREHGGNKEIFGINDIWGIIPFNKAKCYGFRIDETKYYRKHVGRIAGEHYVGWIVKKYFDTIIYSDLKFDLFRGDHAYGVQ